MNTILGIDYPTLWFLVVGALFTGYSILDGFDFGAGAWHLFFRKESSRRIALMAIGPVWDGNEVWLVIGGGALFAGFPIMYASLLSSMYIPFILFLVFIIFRAVSIEFRNKEDKKWWRTTWDIGYSFSSGILAFLLGVVLGNILQGIAIGENFEYMGKGFFEFINVFSVLTGITTLFLLMTHGAIYLLLKTEGRLYAKLTVLVKRSIAFFITSFAITTIYTLIFEPHLSDKFKEIPVLFIVPVAAFLSIANIPRLASKRKFLAAFIFSSLTISLMLILVAIEVYPTLIRSTIDTAYNITIYNAASSGKSLGIMLLIVVIGLPLALGYTLFVYLTFRGKVKIEEQGY